MKRLHIHIAVNELSESINFYSIIFDAPPSIEREDYAKWDLNEPAVNFAISNRGHTSGINHLGIQVDSDNELEEIAKRLDNAEISHSKQEGSSCCYAHSNKHWALDPQGIAWESFHTLSSILTFGEDTKSDTENESSACCTPLNMNEADNDQQAACCIPNEGDVTGCCS
ncbi:MAG: ArsI/CadI family heavy metal resistance metalloenzyme [Methylococcales bacterium]